VKTYFRIYFFVAACVDLFPQIEPFQIIFVGKFLRMWKSAKNS